MASATELLEVENWDAIRMVRNAIMVPEYPSTCGCLRIVQSEQSVNRTGGGSLGNHTDREALVV